MRTVPGRTDRVVVIGAGLGGLSAALHLAGAGRFVTVLERESVPGGRTGLLQDKGFSFDTGPTVLTMPDLLAQPFRAVGEDLHNWLRLHRLDPAYRARYADGTTIDVRADPAAMVEEIRAKCGKTDADGFERFRTRITKLYELELPNFIDCNLDHPFQLVGAPLARLTAMGGFRRLGPKVGSYVKDDRLRKLFSFQAMYAGLAPKQALALYSVITYMDCIAGVYFPEGGLHAVPRAMAGAAEKHGVEIRYGAAASRIEVVNGRARAVITAAGERIPTDVVVVNADLPTAYRDLIDQRYRPRLLGALKYSPSAVVLHAGSGTRYAHTAHHTIEFGHAWDETFTQIIGRGELMSDPSFLVTNPTRTDPTLAPPGKQTYYVLFPAPNLDHRRPIDWRTEEPRYRQHILATLEKRGYDRFGQAAEVVHTTTPADWATQGLMHGAPFAASHLFRQSGPFRHSTLSRRVENLVFAGSNTQPGVGVPMVLISGRLAAQRVTA